MNEDRITITWEADDGYVGGSRPQKFNVRPENFDGQDLEEITKTLMEMIDEDLQQKIRWVSDVDKYAQQIFDALKEDGE